MNRRQPTRQERDLLERDAPPATIVDRTRRGMDLIRAVLAGEQLPEPAPIAAPEGVLHACKTCFAPITGTCPHCPKD